MEPALRNRLDAIIGLLLFAILLLAFIISEDLAGAVFIGILICFFFWAAGASSSPSA